MTDKNWRRRTLIFLTSQCITLFGSTLVQMAVVWYATMQTASGVWVAAFTVCAYLPQFLMSFLGGVWADRFSRKWLIIGADAVIALVTLFMVAFMPQLKTEAAVLVGLLVMSALRSLGAGVQTPAVNATIPQLVPPHALMRYNGINAALQALVNFAAPAAAGAVFALGSLRAILMIDVVTAVVGTALLVPVVLPQLHASPSRAGVFSDMKLGLRYAWSVRRVGALLVLYGLVTFLCVPAGYLAGLLVRRVFGATYWYLTVVEIIGFAGMVLGGLLLSVRSSGARRRQTLVLGLAVFGLAAIGMGVTRDFSFYLVLMFIYGVALTVVQTVLTTMLQACTAVAVQGRVFGLLSTMYAGFLPLGMAVFGPLADVMPLSGLMVGAGVTLFLLAGVVKFCDGDTNSCHKTE